MQTYLFSLGNLSRTYDIHLIYSNQLFSYEYEFKRFKFWGNPQNKTTNKPPCPSKCVISQQFCVYMYIRLWQYLHGGVLHGNFAIHPMLSQHIDFDFPRRQISIDMRSLKLKLSRFYTE